ncbi:Csu type fimbrial protein [Gluconacetobacter tumulisoli]|uniref:Spore coat U domain-containing protein n=1 Tax=Gluconacetobacter tumulisoli TaxID=1286189 RepID=A0A7W4PK90_9PROT|nr:spore coat U domain-containing protein [Gluconacetobacter tumulisoli]MBB2200573.1 spore coat U domain-containing protein [Gluconacetobacter tumulisoli]
MTGRWRRLRRTLLLLPVFILPALATLPAGARAACAVNNPGAASLGAISSLEISQAGNHTEINTGFTCPGSLLSIVYPQTIQAQITAATGLTDTASGDTLPFAICQDSACATQYAVGQTLTWQKTNLLDLLGLFGGPGGTLPLYVQVPSGNYNVAAGTYAGSITIRWSWSLCVLLGIGNLCLAPDTGSTTETLVLSLTITADCDIDAPNLNFGAAPLVSGFAPVSQGLNVRCTRGSAYSVGLGDGGAYDGTSRRMQDPAGDFLRYEIYKQAGAERWGDQGTARRASATADSNAGLLDGVTAQQFTYTAAILTGQTTPPAGTYADTIVVDVQF